jgi:ERCC4-type nuclease
MVVIVDTYEITNNSRTQKELETAKVQYEVRSLTKGGDYIIEGEVEKVVIERKEINDLFSSNHSGRLPKQMNKLVTEYPDYKKILLIEGNISSVVAKRSGGKSNVIDFGKGKKNVYARYSAEFVGIASSIITKSDINIIQVASKWQTIMLLKSLDQWANGKRRGGRVSGESKKVDRDMRREVEDVLLSIFGVGWKNANAILYYYPSLSELAAEIAMGKDDDIKAKLGDTMGSHIIELFRYNVSASGDVKEEDMPKRKRGRPKKSEVK